MRDALNFRDHLVAKTARFVAVTCAAAIGLIVGPQLLGLWKATDLRVFLWTAPAMCLVRGVAAFLSGTTANGNVDLRRTILRTVYFSGPLESFGDASAQIFSARP